MRITTMKSLAGIKSAVRLSSVHTAFLLLVAISLGGPARPTAAAEADAPPAVTTFSFELPRATFTSAGIYDDQGRLVRILWTQRQLDAGRHSGRWDGKDEFGAAVPAGTYSFHVVANGSRYRNVGAIGNSGPAPTPEAHTPTGLLSVAVDDQGAVYTANGWDEAGADFKKWDAEGNSVYDARYQIRNGNPNGAPYAIAVDDEAIYCAMGGWAREPWNHKQQLQRFARRDGKHQRFTKVDDKAGHVQVYEWPEKLIPPGTPPQDAELMREPLRALAISGDTLLVADALGGKVRRYHKVTGQPQGDFGVPLPGALAVAPDGRDLGGPRAQARERLLGARPEDRPGAPRPRRGGRPGLRPWRAALRGRQRGRAGQDLRRRRRQGGVAAHAGRKGQGRRSGGGPRSSGSGASPSIPRGTSSPSRPSRPAGPGSPDGRPQGKLLWEHFGCEFVSLGNYGRQRPRRLLLDDLPPLPAGRPRRPASGNTSAARSAGGPPTRATSTACLACCGSARQTSGSCRPATGSRSTASKRARMRLASILGAGDPDAEGKRGKPGQWSWSDAAGDGQVSPQEVRWFKRPGEARYAVFGVDVDSKGDVWFGELHSKAIWTVPMAGLDVRGNPTYDWSKAREVIPRTAPRWSSSRTWSSTPRTARSTRWAGRNPGPRPRATRSGWAARRWSASTRRGKRLWAVPLPQVCVGMDVIPGGNGGVIVGTGRKAELLHYTADGLLIGSVGPGKAMASRAAGSTTTPAWPSTAIPATACWTCLPRTTTSSASAGTASTTAT